MIHENRGFVWLFSFRYELISWASIRYSALKVTCSIDLNHKRVPFMVCLVLVFKK